MSADWIGGATESWWLKLARADRHFVELEAEINRYTAKRAFRPRRTVTPSDPDDWRYVLEVTEHPGPELAVVLGDVVHNARSALDHVLVAMRPWKERRKPGFPIRLDDPWEIDASGELFAGREQDREAFEQAMSGLSNDAKALVLALQPYRRVGTILAPKAHAMSILSRIDNADKHRELTLIGAGLVNCTTTVTVRGKSLVQKHPPTDTGFPGLVDDGAEIAHFKSVKQPRLSELEVGVDLAGTPLVLMDVGLGDGYMDARDALHTILVGLREDVLPELDSYVSDERRSPRRPRRLKAG